MYILLNCILQVINLLYFRCDLLTNKKNSTLRKCNIQLFSKEWQSGCVTKERLGDRYLKRQKYQELLSGDLENSTNMGETSPERKVGSGSPKLVSEEIMIEHSRSS